MGWMSRRWTWTWTWALGLETGLDLGRLGRWTGLGTWDLQEQKEMRWVFPGDSSFPVSKVGRL